MDRNRYLALIAPAARMTITKGEDYNNKGQDDVHLYFPFGDKSYAQVIYMKARRLVSLAKQEGEPNHEKVVDTVMDLINYAVFYADFLDQRKGIDA
jgi:hypothetical protein